MEDATRDALYHLNVQRVCGEMPHHATTPIFVMHCEAHRDLLKFWSLLLGLGFLKAKLSKARVKTFSRLSVELCKLASDVSKIKC